MAKRKDTKGIVLKTGEHQRKDGRYEYKYKDSNGKRHSVYATTLKELREKESEIEKNQNSNIDIEASKTTVYELVEKYISTKHAIRPSTLHIYSKKLALIKSDDIASIPIGKIKLSDAKLWVIKLHNKGKKFNYIKGFVTILSPAFEMAVEEDAILKNPFKFSLSSVINNDERRRAALTEEQLSKWMTFIKNDKIYSKYYYSYLFLLQTGLRISELCGLTIKDIDFNKKQLHVERQLLISKDSVLYIEETKSDSGRRIIPMNDDMMKTAKHLIDQRLKPVTEPVVDDHQGFLILNTDFQPTRSRAYEKSLSNALKKFRKKFPDFEMPNITLHVYRHTFCTNMANSGIDIKSLQYIMGHSDANVTMNVYAHSNLDMVAKAMGKAPSYDF